MTAYAVRTSTLTAASIENAMEWAKEDLTHDEFLGFMSILGYKHYAKLKSEDTKIIGVEDINIMEAPSPTRNMLKKFEGFLTKKTFSAHTLLKISRVVRACCKTHRSLNMMSGECQSCACSSVTTVQLTNHRLRHQ